MGSSTRVARPLADPCGAPVVLDPDRNAPRLDARLCATNCHHPESLTVQWLAEPSKALAVHYVR